jgi:hypothetical protein
MSDAIDSGAIARMDDQASATFEATGGDRRIARRLALAWLRIHGGLALLIVIAAWAIAVIAPDGYRVFGSLGSFGLVADNDGVIIDTVGPFLTRAESPAVAAGIVEGDRIDLRAMRCLPVLSSRCKSLLAVIGGLGGPQIVRPGAAIDLVVHPARGGASRRVHLQAVRTTRGFADRIVLFADTIVGIVVILAAARLVWLRPSRMTWGFFLYAMWFNPGQTYAYYAMLQPWPIAMFAQEFAEALAHGAGYAGLLIFALRFPLDSPSAPLRRHEWLALAIGVAVFVMWLGSFTNAFGEHTETLTSVALLLGYAIDGLAVLVLIARRRTLPALDGQRMLWVIWGCAIGLPAFIFAELAQSTSLLLDLVGLSLSSAGIGLLYLLNGVLVYFVSVAVTHRRVINVSVPLRHGTILTALSLAVGIPIVNLHERLSHYQDTFPIPEWIWLFVVAPVALVLLQRLHEIGVKLVDRVLNRRFHAARARLAHAGAAMLGCDADEIDRLLVAAPVDALRLSCGAVFRGGDGTFRRGYAIGWDDDFLRELRPGRDAAALRSLATRTIVRLPRADSDETQLETHLKEPCVALPIASESLGAVAIALYGPHVNGNDIDEDEREMLADFARRVVMGYERAAFLGLRKQVAELRARVAALQASPA